MDEALPTNKRRRVTVCIAQSKMARKGRWRVLLRGEERREGSEISNERTITRNKQGHNLPFLLSNGFLDIRHPWVMETTTSF